MFLLQNRYKLVSKLGRGSYGTVYSAHDTMLGIDIAIKLCDSEIDLTREVEVYNLLQRDATPIGIPKLHIYVVDARQEFFVMQLLGPSLRSLCLSRGNRFSPKTVSMLGMQMVTRLESLHDRGILHCDIKDDNFVMSSGIVYIIDFGLCKTFIDSCTRAHVRETNDPNNLGTIAFSSVHTHNKVRSARRDDMEALGYIFVRWLKGYLPWEQWSRGDRFSQIFEEAGFMKAVLSPDMLCKGLPEEFRAYMSHVKNLRFDERPNYNYLRCLLNSILVRGGETNDGIYDWMQIHSVPPHRNSVICKLSF